MSWLLARVAFRKSGLVNRAVVFVGNHVCHYYVLPVQAEGEADDAFEQRVDEFWRSLPRRSDLSLWLSMAHEAFLPTDGTNKDKRAFLPSDDTNEANTYAAASLVLEELEGAVVARSAQQKKLFGKLGIQWTAITSPFGSTGRGYRSKGKQAGVSEAYRRAETVRTQVSRFKRKCTRFWKLLKTWYDCYLYDQRRDEWFQRFEASTRGRFEKNRNDPVMADSFLIASEAVELGRLYRDFGNPQEALPFFHFALGFWNDHGGRWPHLKAEALRQIRQDLESLRYPWPRSAAPL